MASSHILFINSIKLSENLLRQGITMGASKTKAIQAYLIIFMDGPAYSDIFRHIQHNQAIQESFSHIQDPV